MQTLQLLSVLRNARLLARLVLVWFALSIGVAIASPMVKPQSMELICAGAGVIKVVLKTDDAGKVVASHTLDCPLCASSSAPPPLVRLDAAPPQVLAYAMQSIPSARMASLTAPALPARGPPAFS